MSTPLRLPSRVASLAGVACLFSALLLPAACRPSEGTHLVTNEVARSLTVYEAGLDSLDAALDTLARVLDEGRSAGSRRSGRDARSAFRAARWRYKRVEMFTAYYLPWLEREINGPDLARADEDDPETILEPVGFQAVESALYPAVDTSRLAHAAVLARALRGNVVTLRRFGVDTMPGAVFEFDAARHEIARVATLGIAGFDATLSADGLTESAEALHGVLDALRPWRVVLRQRDASLARELDARFDAAIRELRTSSGFDSFDRLAFIVRDIQPLAQVLAASQRTLGIGRPDKPRAWSRTAGSIYDSAAVDLAFFAPAEAPNSPGAAALGERLFADPILSPSGTRSCAFCHVPSLAFTDGRARPLLLDVHGSRRGRNTPTLIGAATQPELFADERAHFLEDQITDVLGSRSEMGGSLALATAAVRARADYRGRFATAFGGAPDSAVTAQRVRYAIAAYLRTLRTGRSRFDRAVAGDTNALDRQERLGFTLFMGRARCGTCHFPPGFGGATPPSLTESEPEVLGVPEEWPPRHPVLDADPGRWGVRRTVTNRGAFRTPSLRNVARTAPYMHNGAFRTLEAVIDFYDAGGGSGIGLSVPNQTLPGGSLHLSGIEKRALVAFLTSLTDTSLDAQGS